MALLKRNQNAFFQKGDKLGQCPLTKVTIDMGNAEPVAQRPYCTPLAKREISNQCIDELLVNGSITPSTSERDSPVILVEKVHIM